MLAVAVLAVFEVCAESWVVAEAMEIMFEVGAKKMNLNPSRLGNRIQKVTHEDQKVNGKNMVSYEPNCEFLVPFVKYLLNNCEWFQDRWSMLDVRLDALQKAAEANDDEDDEDDDDDDDDDNNEQKKNEGNDADGGRSGLQGLDADLGDANGFSDDDDEDEEDDDGDYEYNGSPAHKQMKLANGNKHRTA